MYSRTPPATAYYPETEGQGIWRQEPNRTKTGYVGTDRRRNNRMAREFFLSSLVIILLAFQFHLKKFIGLNTQPLEKIQKEYYN